MAETSCFVSGCDAPRHAKGWCLKHYTRWRRLGSPTARMRGEVVDGRKICPGCGVDKPLPEYGASTRERCLACVAERARQRRAVRPDPPRPKHPAVCEHCGAAFMADKRRWRYCSPECTKARQYRDNWKNVAHRRIKERGVVVERFTREDIFERDGWVCQICHDPIDPAAKWPDTRCASIDHIIPISKDGEHSRANVQAAHLRCNLSKGARILTEVAA